MLTKEYINVLKNEYIEGLYNLITKAQKENDSSTLAFLLENLGRLPENFDGKYLVPLLQSENDRVRFLAVKNVGKLSNDGYLDAVSQIATLDEDSMIRREATSTIGRMRSPDAIPILQEILNDPDPKVVLQAIRALLVFKSDDAVKARLKELTNHPNEIVQSVIDKEFFSKKTDSKSKQPHPASPDFMKNVVVHGDVREVLKCVPDESVHLTFTSPPYYNARDYSVYPSYRAYLEFLEAVFKEVHRITKEGRFFILNTSPIIIPRVSRQHSSKRYPIPFDIHPFLVDMGWEFIDDIIWLKPESAAKKRNAGFLQHRKPLAYKANPITECVMVYRKKSFKLIDWNIRQYDRETVEKSKVLGEYESSNVWKIDPVVDKVHSAVFPVELCNKVIKFYSYRGDLIFDPFGGSGTLGRAAMALGRYFFLTEQEAEYVNRIRQLFSQETLFTNTLPRVVELEDLRRLSEGDTE